MMAKQSNFLQTGEFSCIHCDFKCDSNDQQKMIAHIHTHSENLVTEAMQAMKEHDKRIRAEVLASVKEAFQHRGAASLWGHIAAAIGEKSADFVINAFNEELASVQPAAKALEELLRDAELEGLKSGCNDMNPDGEHHDQDCGHCRRIAELEKARAEGKG